MGEAGSRPSPPQSRGGRRSRQLGRQFRAQLRCLQMGVFIRRYIRRVAGTIKHAVRISRRDPLDGRPSVVHQNAIHCRAQRRDVLCADAPVAAMVQPHDGETQIREDLRLGIACGLSPDGKP